MSSNRSAFAVMRSTCGGALVLTSLACEGPLDPRPEPAISSSSAVEAASASGPARASGHAAIQGTPVQNVRDQRYSFSALATGASLEARGQIDVHFVRFTGEEVSAHAEVTCLAVVGNDAWIGSQVKKLVFEGEEVAGERSMLTRVRDLGEGEGAVDLAALVVFNAVPGIDLTYCQNRPAFPILRESANGNVQVMPQ